MSDRDPLALVRAHIAAFNARDLDTVLSHFADDAVFSTGQDVLVGRRAIRGLFAGAFEAPFEAALELRAAVVQGDTAACELVETLTLRGASTELALAGFYVVRDGLLGRVKVYREGSADAGDLPA